MTQTSKEYALALFELAAEQDGVCACNDALRLIDRQFSDQPEYAAILACPNIPLDIRKGLLTQAFEGSIPPDVLSFLQLLCEKGRIGIFSECEKEFDELYQAFSHVTRIRVVSAVALSDTQKQALLTKLEHFSHSRVVPTYEIDPSILGGLILYLGDKMIDGSILSRLKEVKEVIDK